MEKMHMLDLKEKLGKLPAGEIILDVRTPEEFAEGHLPGAINIDHEEAPGHADELKKYKKIYLHCRSGGRVSRVVPILEQMGVHNIVAINTSGMKDWVEAGYPLVQG